MLIDRRYFSNRLFCMFGGWFVCSITIRMVESVFVVGSLPYHPLSLLGSLFWLDFPY